MNCYRQFECRSGSPSCWSRKWLEKIVGQQIGPDEGIDAPRPLGWRTWEFARTGRGYKVRNTLNIKEQWVFQGFSRIFMMFDDIWWILDDINLYYVWWCLVVHVDLWLPFFFSGDLNEQTREESGEAWEVGHIGTLSLVLKWLEMAGMLVSVCPCLPSLLDASKTLTIYSVLFILFHCFRSRWTMLNLWKSTVFRTNFLKFQAVHQGHHWGEGRVKLSMFAHPHVTHVSICFCSPFEVPCFWCFRVMQR